jgi:hypothetical protein
VAAHAAASSGNAAYTREFEDGATQWSVWYTQYLSRASSHSTKSLQLYQEVLECVSRGQLAPTVLQDLFSGFAQARGTEYTTKLLALSSRFFSGLVRIGAAYSQDQAELVMPGASTPELPPPQFDSNDPARWFQQIAEYAAQLNARVLKAYQMHLEHVATGETAPGRLQQASTEYMKTRLPDHLQEIGRLFFDLLDGLNNLRADYEEDYLRGVLATVGRSTTESAFELRLVGKHGDLASASLSITNSRRERALIRCSVSEVRRVDGVNTAFVPKIAIEPEELDLMPGAEGHLRLALRLEESDFDLGFFYVGAVRITENGKPWMEVPLRIAATRGRGDNDSR